MSSEANYFSEMSDLFRYASGPRGLTYYEKDLTQKRAIKLGYVQLVTTWVEIKGQGEDGRCLGHEFDASHKVENLYITPAGKVAWHEG